MNHDIEVEQDSSISPIEDTALDSHLAAAQFEAIIQAWKGEAIELGGAVPASPVGEVDWDGNLALGQLDTAMIRLCESYSYYSTKDCGPGSTYEGCSPVSALTFCTGILCCGL